MTTTPKFSYEDLYGAKLEVSGVAGLASGHTYASLTIETNDDTSAALWIRKDEAVKVAHEIIKAAGLENPLTVTGRNITGGPVEDDEDYLVKRLAAVRARKEEKAKARRDEVARKYFDLHYDILNGKAKGAVDRIIVLEDAK
jgi:hypothetical protein